MNNVVGNPDKSAVQVLAFAEGHAEQLASDEERKTFWLNASAKIADAMMDHLDYMRGQHR